MNPILEIFSQGEEIVTGHVVDTNAAWLSQQAVQLGFTVSRHTAVGDNLNDLIGLLKEISARADCCICTGGLGPTSDDLTTAAVSEGFRVPLLFDPTAFASIEQYFAKRNKTMPALNRKQALLPEGSVRLDNEWGTAPGFALQHGRCWFVFLPGVPSEMKAIFQAQVRLMLNQRFSLQPGTLVCIKTFGLGESEIQLRMHNIDIPEPVQLGFRASMSEVQTKLWFPPNYPNDRMTALVDTVSALLGDNVFAIDGLGEATGDLVFVVDQLMQSQGQTLALVETASQGLIASLCTGSAWLLESRYEISLARLAQKLSLTVQGDVVTTATAIAEQTRQTSGASLVLVQLYEGDFAALNNKDELVTLHTVLLAGNAKYHSQNSVAGLGKRKQNQAAQLALDLLRRYLQFGRI